MYALKSLFVIAATVLLGYTSGTMIAKQAFPPPKKTTKADIHLTGTNTVLLDVEITLQTVDTFIAAMIEKRMVTPADETLYVLIASPGGYLHAGKEISQALTIPANISLICRFCASDAGLIFAKYKGPRLVQDVSELIMHEMYVDHVTANMIRNSKYAEDLLKESDLFNKELYTLLGMTKEAYEQQIRGTEWRLTGKEIVEAHLADSVVTIDCDPYMKQLAPGTCGVR